MRLSGSRLAMTLLAIALPSVALADLSDTKSLQPNQGLNLDTGEISTNAPRTVPGAPDIIWNGTTITPQGSATAVGVGSGAFAVLSLSVLTFLPGYSNTPIAASDLRVNDAFAVKTNANHYAKVRVQAVSAASITLQFVTYGAPSGTAGSPTITKILNNSSQISPGLPNYGIAPSSIFIVQGNALSDAGAPVLQSSASPGLPLSLNGASISVTVGGVTVRPPIYYTSPGQIAAVLPAATPLGTGTLTVTHNGLTSAPAPIQVVASAVGINTYYGSVGVATDGITGDLITYSNSGAPGQVIVIWATGLGANREDSDTVFASAPHAVNTPLQVYVGGVLARVLYQGSAGYPGVNQINIVIPESAPTGCWVPLAAVTGTVVSNIATLPIRAGGGACVDQQTGLNGSQVAPGGSQTIKTGFVGLIQSDTTTSRGRTLSSSATGAFQKYTGLYSPSNSVSPGGCILNDLTPVPIGAPSGLDAGTITLTGPSGAPVTLGLQAGLKGAYFATLPTGTIPTTGGTFTFKGAGGADVGSFTSVLTLTSPVLTWTNQSAAASVDKTRGLLVTWSGGNEGSYVFITGTAASGTVVGGYTCIAPVEARQFTVPSYILLALPTGSGSTEVQNYITAPLSASGLDVAMAIADVTFSVVSTYGNGGGLSR